MIVHYDSRLARLVLYPRFAAICVGSHVFTWLAEGELTPAMLAHEQCHADQWARYGAIGFLVRYLWWSARHGYRANPLEVEARAAAGEA